MSIYFINIYLILVIGIFIAMYLRIIDLKKAEHTTRLYSKTLPSPVGIYKVLDERLEPISTLPGNGCINDINKELGYEPTKVSTVLSDKLALLEFVVVDKASLKPLYCGLKNSVIVPSYQEIAIDLERIDWNYERFLL